MWHEVFTWKKKQFCLEKSSSSPPFSSNLILYDYHPFPKLENTWIDINIYRIKRWKTLWDIILQICSKNHFLRSQCDLDQSTRWCCGWLGFYWSIVFFMFIVQTLQHSSLHALHQPFFEFGRLSSFLWTAGDLQSFSSLYRSHLILALLLL